MITNVWEDKDGIIWVVARGTDMFTFDRFTEKFIPFRRTAPVNLLTVKGINEDSEGKIWLDNNEGELGRFDKRTGKFINDDLKINYLPDADANTPANLEKICKDRDGALWIAGNKGLHKVSIIPGSAGKPSRLSFTRYLHNPENSNSLSTNQTRFTYQDRSGMIWIGTRMGLNRLNQRTGELTRYLHDPGNPGSISNNDVYGILEDKQGNIWVGTRIGLNKMTKGNAGFNHYFHDDNDPTSLSNNFIMSMMLDSSDILWIGTVGGGISKLDLNQKPIALYQNNPIDSNSLSHNKVSAICEDRFGTVWIGTIGGGLNAWNKKTNKFIHFRNNPLDSSSLGSDLVSAIIEDRDGILWIATGKNKIGILSRLDRKTKKFIHYTFKYKFQNLNYNPLLTLYEDKRGLIWIGTSNGIIRFEPKTKTWNHYPHDPINPEGISDYWANAICEDDHGNLWIGPNSNALNKLNLATGKYTHYIHDPHNSHSISSSIVKSIYKDSKGTIWFATRHGGLCSFDPAKDEFKTFSKRDGLPSNTVYSILEDNDGDLWLTTNKGLSRFTPSTHTFRNYDVNDGLQSNQYEVEIESAGACFKGRDGTLYFGGPNGFNAFHPRNLQSNSKPPVVVITQFKLFDKVIPGKQEAKD